MKDLSDLPPDLRSALEAEISGGERLIYASRPSLRIGPAEVFSAILYIGFTIFWCTISFAFAFFSWAGLLGWAPKALIGKIPMDTWGLMALSTLSLPFVLIGIGMLVAPFYGYWKSRRTIHSVTNERVLTVHAKPFGSVLSHTPNSLTYVNRRDHRNGTGSLRIGYGTERDSDGDTRALEMSWTAIHDPRGAEGAIRNLMKSRA